MHKNALKYLGGTFGVLAVCAGTLFHPSAKADVIILEKGNVITGNVLQQDSDGILIQMDYGTIRYPTSWVKDVKKETVTTSTNSPGRQRIPSWAKIISMLATNEWAHELKQIPASVIDNGILKDVPYVSFRCNASGYEINIYGDLDNPAGVEIGAVNYLLKSDDAKSNCVNFISSVLASADDKKIVQGLNLKIKDVEKRDGMTFEITLPSEPDAYGGWWVSAYGESTLATARASGPELLAITQPRIPPKPQLVAVAPHPAVTPPDSVSSWSSEDLSNARPSVSDSSNTGGRVYVRGYYRKDGTYVHSYTRSYPHRRR
jgi:hypothetical protein